MSMVIWMARKPFARAIATVLAGIFQSVAVGQPINPPTVNPAWIIGGGASYGNPGASGTADVNYRMAAGSAFYFHLGVGSVSFKNGVITAITKPGAQWRFYQDGNVTLGAQAAAGFTVGTSATLSQFGAGPFLDWDACNAIRGLRRFGHCYVRPGAALGAGSTVSTTGPSAIQLVVSVEVLIGR